MDTKIFKNKLIQIKSELEKLEESFKQSTATVVLDQNSVGRLSRMDAMQSQQMALETERRRKNRLLQVKAALIRIDKDDYGYCSVCDEEIIHGRLSIDPTATKCVDCSE